MAPGLVTVGPPADGVYRLARGSDPFAPPDWRLAHDDGTFGNRFDDPSGCAGRPVDERFRTIYAATRRAAAFGETVARFRPSLPLLVALDRIDDDEPIRDALRGVVHDAGHPVGIVPADWRLRRRMGHTALDPSRTFVDIASAATLTSLRRALARTAQDLGLEDIDLSSVTSSHRRFTQACARYVYDMVDQAGVPRFAGIRYVSRLDPTWECWAIFHDRLVHRPGWPALPTNIGADDGDLLTVARSFMLAVEVVPGADLLIP